MSSRPNIVFLLADDQRFDTIGALGNPEIHTPHLDRLVGRGTSFSRAHIPGGTVGAICMPSRAMIHTGRTLFHLEKNGAQVPPSHALLGETFRKAGYHTHGIGKWHNGTEAFHRSFSSGEHLFFGGMWDHWNVPVHDFDPTGAYTGRIPIIPDPFHSNQVHQVVANRVHHGVHSSELFTDGAISFLERADPAKPFFLSVAYLAPHDPRSMPERFLKMYDPASLTLPKNFLPQHPFAYIPPGMRDEQLAGLPRGEQEVRRHIAEYFAMISHLDDQLGRIFTSLEEKGLLANTLVVFAGDNGLAVGCHGLMGKQNLYEHSVRVPLLLAGPGVPIGHRSEANAYLLDIFPTLCALAQVTVPETVEGKSLLTNFREPPDAHREVLYLAYANAIRGVEKGGMKLLEYAGGPCGRQTQLFDTRADPFETMNLAEDPARKDLLAQLRVELFAQRDKWGDENHDTGKYFWGAYRGG